MLGGRIGVFDGVTFRYDVMFDAGLVEDYVTRYFYYL